jgi:hypothetical protein
MPLAGGGLSSGHHAESPGKFGNEYQMVSGSASTSLEDRLWGGGCFASVVTAPLFLATKLEAFKDRGKGDYYLSHDLEDMITLVDGRAAIVEEVAAATAEIRQFVSNEFSKILKHPDFRDALPGHLPAMLGFRERTSLVVVLAPV